MRWEFAIVSSLAAIVPATAHAQCARMVGSNQIICPGYRTSTVPVYTGPGGYVPARGMLGAGQLVFGVGTGGYSAYRGNQVGVMRSAGTIANGYYNVRNYPIFRYQPQIAYPAARPYGYRW